MGSIKALNTRLYPTKYPNVVAAVLCLSIFGNAAKRAAISLDALQRIPDAWDW